MRDTTGAVSGPQSVPMTLAEPVDARVAELLAEIERLKAEMIESSKQITGSKIILPAKPPSQKSHSERMKEAWVKRKAKAAKAAERKAKKLTGVM